MTDDLQATYLQIAESRDSRLLAWYFRRGLAAIPRDLHPQSNQYRHEVSAVWASSATLSYKLGVRAGRRSEIFMRSEEENGGR